MYSGPPWCQLSASTGCLLGPAVSQSHAACQLYKQPLVGLFLRNVKFSSTHESIEQQGSVSSPLRCSITTDSLGKDILSNFQLSQALYKFKGFLPIHPLIMIDNILTVSRGGFDSLLFFSYILGKIK